MNAPYKGVKLTREDVLKIVEEAHRKGERPNLREVNLNRANLRGGNFSRANLGDANLSGANLSGANLSDVDLSDANLSGGDLSLANLSGANLSDANLSGAICGITLFSNVDLSKIKGVETVKHLASSEISLSTVYKSKGNIPEVFLRGCGVPENFIEYMHSLTGSAFDYYSCFISHSSKDATFAERLHADLQANGVRCWYAPHDMQAGKKLHMQIKDAIRVHEKLLLILSEHSLNSNWVKTEILEAKKREAREGNQILFPISLVSYEGLKEWEFFDSDTGCDLAKEIREYFIPYFKGWETDNAAYKKEFEKLLRDMKSKSA